MKCNYKFVFERLNSNANKFINQSINLWGHVGCLASRKNVVTLLAGG